MEEFPLRTLPIGAAHALLPVWVTTVSGSCSESTGDLTMLAVSSRMPATAQTKCSNSWGEFSRGPRRVWLLPCRAQVLKKEVFVEATLSWPMTSFVRVRIFDLLQVQAFCRLIILKPSRQVLTSGSSSKRENFIVGNCIQKVQKTHRHRKQI